MAAVEIAHVLFMDMVGYSRRTLEDQADLQETLHTVVRTLEEFQHARAEGKLIELPAGDGMALVFFGDPEAPVKCALSLQRAIRDLDLPMLQLRTGIHSGPVSRGGDITGAVNARGPGINEAQRVMDCGDAGHILLSRSVAEVLLNLRSWSGLLHDLGECTVKHDKKIHLFNLFTEDVGNPDIPARLAAPKPAEDERNIEHNLPQPPTSLVGREKEIALWSGKLREPTSRVLTLTGFGGIGKSRSALHLAWQCVESHATQYPDGVWWFELAEARTGDAMFQRMAYDLNLYLQPPPAAREQLFNFLRARKCLLVLDNLEQIPDAGAVVSEILKAAPGVKLLVTSRCPLELRAEQQAEVPPLPPQEGEQLFIERARARQADFELDEGNAAAIADLCRQLEGVPLAIELAAARIVGMEPSEIGLRLQSLGGWFNLLKTRSPDLPARQRALRATIDWSYELLQEEDQLLFAQLAVFSGGFSLEDAEKVGEVTDVMEGLMELRRHSILLAESAPGHQQKRFSMLESLRTYAVEKLDELGPSGLESRKRHADHFLNRSRKLTASLRTPGEAAALRTLEADFGNLQAALEYSLQDGHDAQAAELSLALGQFMGQRGFFAEAARRVETGMETLLQLPDPPAKLHAALLREQAGLCLDQFDWPRAQQVAARAADLAGAASDLQGRAAALNLLGLAASGLDEVAVGRSHFEEALALSRQAGDERGAANALNNLGTLEYKDDQRDAAATRFEETLALRRKQGDTRGAAEAILNLGVIAYEAGTYDTAWQHYREALQLELELGHVFGVGRALSNLGEAAEAQGSLELACRLFAAAECLFAKIGSPYRQGASEQLQHTVMAWQEQTPDALDRSLPHAPPECSLDELIIWALE